MSFESGGQWEGVCSFESRNMFNNADRSSVLSCAKLGG